MEEVTPHLGSSFTTVFFSHVSSWLRKLRQTDGCHSLRSFCTGETARVTEGLLPQQATYLRFSGNVGGLEGLKVSNNSVIITETTHDLWNPNEEGLCPPFHQFVPGEGGRDGGREGGREKGKDRGRSTSEGSSLDMVILPLEAGLVSVCKDGSTGLQFNVVLRRLVLGHLGRMCTQQYIIVCFLMTIKSSLITKAPG